ncbi:MAG TPA: aromatic acid exporter family protein [Erysipelotrichaceae bacterium]|nr:aromatic acid exporter family protein [Erysipelotrichaceae bacterium]
MKKPFIGLRTIKTIVAVFISMVLSSLREGSRPFYSAIAAVLCMQKDSENSFRVGKNRFIATIVGAVVGCLFLVFEHYVYVADNQILRYLLISIFLIPVIYTCVYIHKEGAVGTGCVVYLSIVINYVGKLPFLFAFNRFLDTTIGIVVSILVNAYLKNPFKKEQPRNSEAGG